MPYLMGPRRTNALLALFSQSRFVTVTERLACMIRANKRQAFSHHRALHLPQRIGTSAVPSTRA